MNRQHCQKIAEHMNTRLLNELGQGVDALRMVVEPLYARDVLLVCDAMPGTELATLAQQFRVAAAEAPPSVTVRAGPDTDTGARNSSGFGASMWSRLASGFGFGPSTLDAPPATPGRADDPPRRR